MSIIQNDWLDVLENEFTKDYYNVLTDFIEKEYDTREIYPPKEDIFNAFHVTPLKNVKIVILGQDPYHGMGQAHGMSFSVKKDIDIPPSLVNIYKELYSDIGCRISEHGNLTSWAEQGVLLLNTVLTVRSGHPHSHRNIGWEKFTDAAIRGLNEQDRPIVYFLWGNAAKQKKAMLTNPKHLVIESAHPSPLSAYKGFFGSKPFSQANDFLIKQGLEPIDWQVEN